MAVRIRLKRMGKIHAPFYRVVVVDSRKKRDGRVIEEIGTYDPMPNPSKIHIESDRAQYWLGVGAQPSDAVRKLLVLTGDVARFNGKDDVVSRVEIAEVDREKAVQEAVAAAEATAEKSKAQLAAEKAKADAAKAEEANDDAEAKADAEGAEAAAADLAAGE